MTVMGDALMNGLSDRGSIPLRSTKNREHVYVLSVLFSFLRLEMKTNIIFHKNEEKMFNLC